MLQGTVGNAYSIVILVLLWLDTVTFGSFRPTRDSMGDNRLYPQQKGEWWVNTTFVNPIESIEFHILMCQILRLSRFLLGRFMMCQDWQPHDSHIGCQNHHENFELPFFFPNVMPIGVFHVMRGYHLATPLGKTTWLLRKHGEKLVSPRSRQCNCNC